MKKPDSKPRTESVLIDGRDLCRLDQGGVTLLEILIAVSILGICFSALFSGFSAALRTADRVDRYSQAVEFANGKLNQLLVDPTLGPSEVRSGATSGGLNWRAITEVVDERPRGTPDKPIQLLRVVLEVSWQTPVGSQSFAVQTLKFWLPPAESIP